MDRKLIEQGTLLILKGMGVNPKDHNYKRTPYRYAKALREMFEPKTQRFPMFSDKYEGMIITRDHLVYTLCPHHLLPVQMRVSMAYFPSGKVLGLSKLPRLVADLNRHPLLQEEVTTQLADRLYDGVPGSLGSAVFIRGEHSCMQIRGIKTGADVVTTAARGEFVQPLQWSNFLRIVKP